jgi:hypothetical protein
LKGHFYEFFFASFFVGAARFGWGGGRGETCNVALLKARRYPVFVISQIKLTSSDLQVAPVTSQQGFFKKNQLRNFRMQSFEPPPLSRGQRRKFQAEISQASNEHCEPLGIR